MHYRPRYNFFPTPVLSALCFSLSIIATQGMDCLLGAPGGLCKTETPAAASAYSGPGDDLFVNELLDFSHWLSDAGEPVQKLEESGQNVQQDNVVKPPPLSQEKQPKHSNAILSESEHNSLPDSVFMPPEESLESLEWLSHFVEDSFSDFSLTGKLPPKPLQTPPSTESPLKDKPSFVSGVQTKARTKRPRHVWPVLSHSFPESTATSSSSSSSSASSFISQKKKRKPSEDSGAAVQARRCSHCGVTKTPQWRAGPLGSKTLCNACGVRYKSGRLLPEYRPACSPTFSSELHSNNHRKVMEMRRKKETETETETEAAKVTSF